MSFLSSQKEREHTLLRIIRILSNILLVLGTIGLPLVFLPYTQDTINLPKSLFLYGFALVALFLWLLQISVSKVATIRSTVLDLPIAAFLGVSLISSLFSRIPAISFLGKTHDYVFHTALLAAFVVWFYVLIQRTRNSVQWRTLVHAILGTSVVAALVFLFPRIPFFEPIVQAVGFNTVSSANSSFALFMGIVGVLSLGLLVVKKRSLLSQGIPFLALMGSLAVLIRAEFAIGWIVFAVGAACILIFGMSMIGETRVSLLSVAFSLFLVSLLFLFFSAPPVWNMQLPVEVALGAQPSWEIARETVVSDAKHFLIGSGPGTFVQDFSLHRPQAFNMSEVAWAIRFEHPYNVFFGLIAEIGILGVLSFFFLVLFALGSVVGAWRKVRPSSLADTKKATEGDAIHLEIFAVVAALIAATVGMAIAYYDVALWWLWWTLLACTIVGLSAYVPSFIREKQYQLTVSPQYSLALSFSMILFFTVVVVLSLFAARLYKAEIAFTRAIGSLQPAKTQLLLEEAHALRPGYAPYLVALSQTHLEQARIESEQPNPSGDAIVAYMGQAVNRATEATDVWEHDVETWQTRAVMYQHAQSFTANALDWSVDAYKEAILLEPTNPLLHWRLGQVEAARGNSDLAKESMQRAIGLKQDYLPPYLDLAVLYERERDLTSAIEIFRPPAFDVLRQDGEVLFTLGRLYYNRAGEGDFDRAEQVWLEAVQRFPEYANALYSLGLLYEKTGRRSEAVAYFNRVQAIHPDNPDIGAKIEDLLAPIPVVEVEE